MGRNISQKYGIPSNATFKSFERSDGDQSTWPRNTERVVDDEGHVNFMDHVTIDMPAAIKWRSMVGEALAKTLEWPKDSSYILQDWPQGYRMFDHNKGHESDPRHDIYLFGPKRIPKFRSPFEFIPHAIWLFTDPTMDNANCRCKYCAKKSQRAVMADSGILPATPNTSPGSSARRVQPKHPKPQPPNNRKPAVHASIRRALRDLKTKHPPSHLLTGPMVAERDAAIRAVYADTDMTVKRWLREDEVIWVALETPIPGPLGESDSVCFWPGVVESASVKPEAIPLFDPASFTDLSDHLYEPDKPLWKVKQYTMYTVKLLATISRLTVPDDRVLPYLAYIPPTDLIASLRQVPLESMKYDNDYISKFHPCPESLPFPETRPPPNFIEAAGPLALAFEIASALTHYWGLTDEWESSRTISLPSKRPPVPSSSTRTLTEVLSAASSRNAVDPVPSYGTFQETRFQGMWWGCERIWTGDFVRLKLMRKAIVSNSENHVLPAAGPGKIAARALEGAGLDSQEAGAASRGTFMRLDSLFLFENGKQKEIRASGMLYELVDEDWEDEDVRTNVVVPSHPDGSSISHVAPPNPSVHRNLGSSETSPQKMDSRVYTPPLPPKSFHFRPILEDGYEAVFSLTLISGRYYPGISDHPILDQFYHSSMNDLNQGKQSYSHLWVLVGLLSGALVAMDPVNYKRSDRQKMLEEAHLSGRNDLTRHLEQRMNDEDGEVEADALIV